MDIDISDEATGLPPLSEILGGEDLMVALQWQIGAEGVVTIEDEDVDVQYLSVRGLEIAGEEGQARWVQVHVGIPTVALPDLLAEWQKRLA